MLIRKDNQIEIWSNGWNKGYTFLIILSSILAIIFIISGIIGYLDGDIVEGLLVAIIIPSILFFISIKMFLQEKESYLMLVIDSNYIAIYDSFKRNTIIKKIPLEQIININLINSHSRYFRGFLAKIIYNEDNKQKKYSFQIVDKECFKNAIREYRKDLLIQ